MCLPYTLSLTSTVPSLCGFWHCHPYILLHFWKMFFIIMCLHAFLLYHSTIHVQEVVALQVKPTPLVGMYDSIIMFAEAQNLDFSYLGSIFG